MIKYLLIQNEVIDIMKSFFALCDRDLVLRRDNSFLSREDLDVLRKYCKTTEDFEEKSSDIEVIGLTKEAVLPEEYQWVPIRKMFATLGSEACFSLARAKALLEWRKNTRYCGRCGAELKEHETLTARYCPECDNLIFPRIEPCIIVVVHREDGKILLARHVQRNQNIYACIAGFMEAGESAERTVEREIFEETGIKVKNVKYFGSQSWPFPSQLMLGFTAEYESGELKLQADEISDADWFDKDNCPASPQPGSIAYRLIHET